MSRRVFACFPGGSFQSKLVQNFYIEMVKPMNAKLVMLLLALMTTTALAQTAPLPRTDIIKDRNGKVIATVTFSENRAYLRKNNGELIAQVIFERDGTRRILDITGTPVDQNTLAMPTPTEPPPEQTGEPQ